MAKNIRRKVEVTYDEDLDTVFVMVVVGDGRPQSIGLTPREAAFVATELRKVS